MIQKCICPFILLLLASLPLATTSGLASQGPIRSAQFISGPSYSQTSDNAIILRSLYPPVQPLKKYLGIFYYGWYGNQGDGWNHWNFMGVNPPSTWASDYLPDIGNGYNPTVDLYDSNNETIIARQAQQISDAGIDFGIYSWWGQGSYEDQHFQKLLSVSHTAAPGLKWAVLYEKDSISDPSVPEIVSDLTYVSNKYAGDPSYLKVEGKPVVLVFRGQEASITNFASRWKEAREAMYQQGNPFFIILHAWHDFKDQTVPGRNTHVDYEYVVDSWFDYVPARFDFIPSYSAYVEPGYYEFPQLCEQRWAGQQCEKVQRDADQFDNSLQQLGSLTLQEAPFRYIISFNEYHEGSMVEPAYPVKTMSSGYTLGAPSWGTTYLDLITKHFIHKAAGSNNGQPQSSNGSDGNSRPSIQTPSVPSAEVATASAALALILAATVLVAARKLAWPRKFRHTGRFQEVRLWVLS